MNWAPHTRARITPGWSRVCRCVHDRFDSDRGRKPSRPVSSATTVTSRHDRCDLDLRFGVHGDRRALSSAARGPEVGWRGPPGPSRARARRAPRALRLGRRVRRRGSAGRRTGRTIAGRGRRGSRRSCPVDCSITWIPNASKRAVRTRRLVDRQPRRPIGSHGHEASGPAGVGRAEPDAHGLDPAQPQRIRRHREGDVLVEQGDEGVDVVALERLDVPIDDGAGRVDVARRAGRGRRRRGRRGAAQQAFHRFGAGVKEPATS